VFRIRRNSEVLHKVKGQEIPAEAFKPRKSSKKDHNCPSISKSDYGAQKQRNVIEVVLGNLIISKDNQYAAIEVIKSLGIGAKFEIYYFKRVNGKWVPDGNEVIALG
jgi:hypothetical protein